MEDLLVNNISKKVLFYIVRYIIPLIIKKQNDKIIFVKENSSGCNATALYNWGNQNDVKYDLELFHHYTYDNSNLLSYIKKLTKLSKAKLIITTHGTIGLRGRLEINTWHSVHLKATGVMENPTNSFKAPISWQRVNYLLSYSTFYTTTMNACFVTNPNKFKITGMPRNDLLFTSNGRKNIEKVLKKDLNDKKLIFFMPTFRMGYSSNQGNKNFMNLFGFDNFNEEDFNEYLVKNDIILVYKLHPNEEPYLDKYTNGLNSEYSLNLSDKLILDAELDLYDVLNSCDLLMTDYSGIYFDYLLLDRPVVFLPVDLEDYKKSRGFLYEPYEEWTPGPKVIEQNDLQEKILKILNDKSFYEKDRRRLKKIIHKYDDHKSSQRIWNFIDSIIKEGK
ncbi:MAG: hypothetical protein GQ570_01785 [Helicobacteraceae bacterium]|nr:hypothetical protein [Helicobacteraceae bacterium]